ncbi:MAG TPA: serine/threonine-protein kinase, partial [Gemmatimonadales bacterium]|nr:serine/threonine-protein kinase [Gemmatimonadales bacterium]
MTPTLLLRSDQLRAVLADRYAIGREIGRGGMAVVYLAHDLKHDRPVAIKVLGGEVTAALDPRRFQREIRIAAQLHHPHILPVYDSGADAGVLWFTMPYVEGETLRQRLRRLGPLPVDEAIATLQVLARALAYAHRRGVMHRDIKPENVLLGEDGLFLADFGIARPLERAGDPQLTG